MPLSGTHILIRFTAGQRKHQELRVGNTRFDRAGKFIACDESTGTPIAEIPFADLGRECEITCHCSVSDVPLLEEIVNLAWLLKGYLPLHASGFAFGHTGIACAGFAQGGKTGVLLSAMDMGADFLSDDCLLLGDSSNVFGSATPLTIKSRYLDQLPSLCSQISSKLLKRLSHRVRQRTWCRWAGTKLSSKILPAKLKRKLTRLIPEDASLEIPPNELFGSDRCRSHGELKIVLLTTCHDSDATLAHTLNSEQLVHKLKSVVAEQLAVLQNHYEKIKFALTDFRSDGLEEAPAKTQQLSTLHGQQVDGYELFHPHQGSIEGYKQSLAKLIKSHSSQSEKNDSPEQLNLSTGIE